MTRSFMLFAIASVLLGACVTSGEGDSTETLGSPIEATGGDTRAGMMGMGGERMEMCPMGVEGTTVEAIETPSGIAMSFNTTSDVSEIQHRASAMMGKMRAMEGEHAAHMMPPHTVSVETREAGARLIFEPEDPADLPALREHVRERADMMADGKCPMMGMMKDTPSSQPAEAPTSHHQGHH